MIDPVLAPYRDLRDEPSRTAVILAAHNRGLTEHLPEGPRLRSQSEGVIRREPGHTIP